MNGADVASLISGSGSFLPVTSTLNSISTAHNPTASVVGYTCGTISGTPNSNFVDATDVYNYAYAKTTPLQSITAPTATLSMNSLGINNGLSLGAIATHAGSNYPINSDVVTYVTGISSTLTAEL
jgi:hypothetical protein